MLNKLKYILDPSNSHPLPLTALHTLGILSTSFTWKAFPTVLKEFPLMLSTCWLLFLSAVQLIPNHCNWVEVMWFVGGQVNYAVLPMWNIDISVWTSLFAWGHCHAETGKVLPPTVATKLEAQNCSRMSLYAVALRFPLTGTKGPNPTHKQP